VSRELATQRVGYGYLDTATLALLEWPVLFEELLIIA